VRALVAPEADTGASAPTPLAKEATPGRAEAEPLLSPSVERGYEDEAPVPPKGETVSLSKTDGAVGPSKPRSPSVDEGDSMPRRPFRLWSQDESRFGLITIQRRRITLRGVKPVGRFQQKFDNFYVFGAVEPATGEGFFREAPKLNSETFGTYLKALASAYPKELNVVLVDNSRAHAAKMLVIPENVRLLFLPPYSPELNPIERLWQAIKAELAWACPETIEILGERVRELLDHLSSHQIRSLTSYDYILQALHGLFL
jgi:transposase